MNTVIACFLAAGFIALAPGAAPANAKPIDYAAVGASDAVGVGAHPLSEGYVYLIRRELDQWSGRGPLVNLGVSGARIDEINAAVGQYLGSKPTPDLVTVWAGANDLVGGGDAGAFEAGLRALLERLASETAARIVVANLPDLTRLPAFRGSPVPTVTRARIDAFNEAISRQAAARGAMVVDLSSERIGDDLVERFDGFHPSNEGHQALADRFLGVILPILNLG